MCVLENLVTEERRSHHTILIGLGPESIDTHCLNPNMCTFVTPPKPMVAVSPTRYLRPRLVPRFRAQYTCKIYPCKIKTDGPVVGAWHVVFGL